MLSFPDEYELIGLFESEPELFDGEDKPWAYNELKFTTVRGDDQVVVTIYPPSGKLTVACRSLQ